MKINVINGPNLNLLGVREKNIYGKDKYAQLCQKINDYAASKQIIVNILQSNSEGDLINLIHDCLNNADALIINPGAFAHYSFAIRDAISAINLPTVEVHLSNIFSRDEFRKKSITAEVCTGQICGLGSFGYLAAIDFLAREKSQKKFF